MMKLHFFLAFFLFTGVSFGQIDLGHNISDTEKLYGLSTFWSEAKYNFAFFDQTNVNWDSALLPM